MDIPFSSTSPAKLYAIVLKLRPLERGTLMSFSGELVHGAWLEWLRAAAPDVADWLHEGNKRRLFTCSALQFPLPAQRMQQAERENVHLPLDPEKTYTVRITLLLSELFPLFYNSLMHFNMAELGTKRQPFMKIGKQSFLLEEVYHLNTAGQASPRGSQGREKDRVLDSGRCFEPFVTRSPMGRSTLLGKSEGRCILLAC